VTDSFDYLRGLSRARAGQHHQLAVSPFDRGSLICSQLHEL